MCDRGATLGFRRLFVLGWSANSPYLDSSIYRGSLMNSDGCKRLRLQFSSFHRLAR
jgi:hypothetical protein